MRALLSRYGSRGDVGHAVQLGALGAEVRVCASPDFAELPPVATGVMPTGGWR